MNARLQWHEYPKEMYETKGKDVRGFADKFLFGPLGIIEYVWNTHKNGKLEYWNGLHLFPRDMAKIGLLVLNDGK